MSKYDGAVLTGATGKEVRASQKNSNTVKAEFKRKCDYLSRWGFP